MKCSVPTCKKEVETPLILYNGDWICPFCGNPLVNDNIVFKITRKSDELYKMSEILYYNSLNQSENLRRDNYIKSAVSKCIEAMELGDPRAYVRLGFYYDKDYVDLNRSESIRTKIAYQYYSAVVYNSTKEIDVEDGVESVSLLELKKYAAEYMLKMLLDFNDEDSSGEKFTYEYNAKKVRELLSFNIDTGNRVRSSNIGNIERILNTLNGCKNRKRAPIFGIYTLLSKKELELLFTSKDGAIYDLIDNEKIDVVAYAYNKNNKVDERPLSLNTKGLVKGTLEELNDNSKVALVFFNKRNGHNFLKKKEVKEVERFLLDEPNGYLEMHINNIFSRVERFYERVYFDDDIYFYKLQKKKVSDCLIELCSGK